MGPPAGRTHEVCGRLSCRASYTCLRLRPGCGRSVRSSLCSYQYMCVRASMGEWDGVGVVVSVCDSHWLCFYNSISSSFVLSMQGHHDTQECCDVIDLLRLQFWNCAQYATIRLCKETGQWTMWQGLRLRDALSMCFSRSMKPEHCRKVHSPWSNQEKSIHNFPSTWAVNFFKFIEMKSFSHQLKGPMFQIFSTNKLFKPKDDSCIE